MDKAPLTRHATQPYQYIRVADYWFVPWEEPHPSRKDHFLQYPGYWRIYGGAKWSTQRVKQWANARHLTTRLVYHTPKLIDEAAEARLDRILNREESWQTIQRK